MSLAKTCHTQMSLLVCSHFNCLKLDFDLGFCSKAWKACRENTFFGGFYRLVSWKFCCNFCKESSLLRYTLQRLFNWGSLSLFLWLCFFVKFQQSLEELKDKAFFGSWAFIAVLFPIFFSRISRELKHSLFHILFHI